MTVPCYYCGERLTKKTKTREHLLPVSKGGGDVLGNIVAACKRCNVFVGDWDVDKKNRFKRLLQESGGWGGLPVATRGNVDRFRVEGLVTVAFVPTVARIELDGIPSPNLSDRGPWAFRIGVKDVILGGKYCAAKAKAKAIAENNGVETAILLGRGTFLDGLFFEMDYFPGRKDLRGWEFSIGSELLIHYGEWRAARRHAADTAKAMGVSKVLLLSCAKPSSQKRSADERVQGSVLSTLGVRLPGIHDMDCWIVPPKSGTPPDGVVEIIGTTSGALTIIGYLRARHPASCSTSHKNTKGSLMLARCACGLYCTRRSHSWRKDLRADRSDASCPRCNEASRAQWLTNESSVGTLDPVGQRRSDSRRPDQ